MLVLSVLFFCWHKLGLWICDILCPVEICIKKSYNNITFPYIPIQLGGTGQETSCPAQSDRRHLHSLQYCGDSVRLLQEMVRPHRQWTWSPLGSRHSSSRTVLSLHSLGRSWWNLEGLHCFQAKNYSNWKEHKYSQAIVNPKRRFQLIFKIKMD